MTVVWPLFRPRSRRGFHVGCRRRLLIYLANSIDLAEAWDNPQIFVASPYARPLYKVQPASSYSSAHRSNRLHCTAAHPHTSSRTISTTIFAADHSGPAFIRSWL